MEKARERIDIVYLWVNGADQAWRRKRERVWAKWACQHPDALEMYGNVEGRYRDNDELRFSLRALERFFPRHGKVWIVTDGQRPAWLRDTSGVEIVDHRELIPSAFLPVFNSGHIESWIHRLPGLSERFFYMNDDVFFGAPVVPEQWFGEKVTLFVDAENPALYDDLQPQETSMVNAATLSRHWMASRYTDYRHDPRLFAHAPRPLLKSVLHEFEALAPDMFAQVRSSPFRNWRKPPIICDLVLRWMVHVGYARRAVTPDTLYIATGDRNAALQFARLRARFDLLSYFCINDTCDDAQPDDVRLQRIARILPELLPEPSRFELPDVDVGLARGRSDQRAMEIEQLAL